MVAYGLPGTGISTLVELLAAHQSDNVDDIIVYTKTTDAKVPKPDLGLFSHLKRHRKIRVHSPTELFHATKKEAFDFDKMEALFASRECWTIIFFDDFEEYLKWKVGSKSLANYLADKLPTNAGNKIALWMKRHKYGIAIDKALKDAFPHIVISASMPIDNMWRLNKEITGDMTVTLALNYVTALQTEEKAASGVEREIPWDVVKATDGHLYSANPKQRIVHLNKQKGTISSGFYYALIAEDRKNAVRVPGVQAMDFPIVPREYALELIRQKTPQRICEVGDATAAWDGIPPPAVKPGKQCCSHFHTRFVFSLLNIRSARCATGGEGCARDDGGVLQGGARARW